MVIHHSGDAGICRESARETDEKRCSSECARPGGLHRLGGDRVSSQLPQLLSKKGSHRNRQLAEKAEDAVVKKELLDLADVCEEVANNIEDRLTSG